MTTKKPDSSLQIEGVFISFPADELAEIRAELDRRGYMPDQTGLREFLLDALFAEEPETPAERFTRKAKKYVIENPELVRMGFDTARDLLRGFVRKTR